MTSSEKIENGRKQLIFEANDQPQFYPSDPDIPTDMINGSTRADWLRSQENDNLMGKPTVEYSNHLFDDQGYPGKEVTPIAATSSVGISRTRHLLSMWYTLVVVITPIVLYPILNLADEGREKATRCAYVIAIIAVYWTSEAIPVAVTSLLPVVLFPALGIMPARETSSAYFNDTSMLFVGGLLVAIAAEVWNVHKRVALLVLRAVGSEPKRLLLGITLVTWFLSMWISNTATTAMMMTIVMALMEQVSAFYQSEGLTSDGQDDAWDEENDQFRKPGRQPPGFDSKHLRDKKARDADLQRMKKALCLTVAYAANIGGVGSLTGTAPNLVFFASARKTFEDRGLQCPVTFTSWMVYGIPLSLLCAIALWFWMVTFFFRCRNLCNCCCCKASLSENVRKLDNVITEEYNKLGSITYAQASVLVLFFLLLLLWVTSSLDGSTGWSALFLPRYVSESTPSILIGMLMFALPSSLPVIFRRGKRSEVCSKITPLLTWQNVHEKMPWSLYLLVGGGFAMAKASTDSGLSNLLGQKLLVFQGLDKWLILLVLTYIVAMATEITSNAAMATLMMPILTEMALAMKLNPLIFTFPCALATSFAFMLPVATPPNAIVFAGGSVRTIDMACCGFVLNVVCVLILVLATITWGNAYFHFDQVPETFLTDMGNATTPSSLAD